MVNKVLIRSTIPDSRVKLIKNKLKGLNFHMNIHKLAILDAYTIEKKLSKKELHKISQSLFNPVVQELFNVDDFRYQFSIKEFDWVVEIGFLPGVTDNIGNTVRELATDTIGKSFDLREGCYSSRIYLIKGNLKKTEVDRITSFWHNPLIQKAEIRDYAVYCDKVSRNINIPSVSLINRSNVNTIDLDISDDDLEKIGKYGIENSDGTRRGPLALSVLYLKTIRSYFKSFGRNPTDIELESLAQTWSEHCKHTIFSNQLDNIKDGLFNHYIKRATEEIRKKRGKSDICVSVFKDNSGGVKLNDKYIITHKVETHNTPCALDPFGGAITGIVGVNRDTLGYGLGAKPVANYYGFCLADPRIDVSFFRNSDLSGKMLSSRRILDGVVAGVNAGGNQSGIPTPSGFIFFDEKYRGKPLVFVGTVGVLPRKINKKKSDVKRARVNDFIVMVGGRVGKDGIHGATFSSESLNPQSPVTAVQIGDPITQKKLSDALIKEARDLDLYNSITDNGAGGLSCSVAEMAKESNGCIVFIDMVPVKYLGLAPWEIWISESQERMTLAVPQDKWKKLQALLNSRGVEATVIGKFTSDGVCRVLYKDKTIMEIDLDFLHNGLPKQILTSSHTQNNIGNPPSVPKKNYTEELLKMLERPSLASFEFITKQFDHTVQGNLTMSPLQGRGRVNSETTAIRPILTEDKAVMMSYGLYSSYSEIDSYKMAAATIDTAIRNLIAGGGSLDKICLLDNFCWTDSLNPYRLGQLKDAVKACYDYATYYQTPYISGKDSMFNEFKGYDSNGKTIVVQIPPTLLISSLAVIDYPENMVSLDFKNSGDLIYLLGETFNEMGGSEYYRFLCDKKTNNNIGSIVPEVNSKINILLYKTFYRAVTRKIFSSSISVGRGGLGIALAKSAIGGMLGIKISLKNISKKLNSDDELLFSESQGRILVSISPYNKKKFEKIFNKLKYYHIGTVTSGNKIEIKGINNKTIIKCNINNLLKSYRKTFKDY